MLLYDVLCVVYCVLYAALDWTWACCLLSLPVPDKKAWSTGRAGA